MRDVVERLAKLPPGKRALPPPRAGGAGGISGARFHSPSPSSGSGSSTGGSLEALRTTSLRRFVSAERSNVRALEASLGEITRRHEVLRTSLPRHRRKAHPGRSGIGPFRIPSFDLRPLTVPEREAQVLALAAEEAARPFDLTHGLVFRATVLRVEEQDHVLLLNTPSHRGRRLVHRASRRRAQTCSTRRTRARRHRPFRSCPYSTVTSHVGNASTSEGRRSSATSRTEASAPGCPGASSPSRGSSPPSHPLLSGEARAVPCASLWRRRFGIWDVARAQRFS